MQLRAACVAGWCCLPAGVGFLVLCRAAAPGTAVSSWPWQSLCFQGGWNRADWRFRGHRALRRHRLERVKEPIRSRDRRKLRAASRLLSAKSRLEIFANSKSTQIKMSLLFTSPLAPALCPFHLQAQCALLGLGSLFPWPKKWSEIFLGTINCFPCCPLNGDVSTDWKS